MVPFADSAKALPLSIPSSTNDEKVADINSESNMFLMDPSDCVCNIETIPDSFVTDKDVLEGRNEPPRRINAHPGNQNYKTIIRKYAIGHENRKKKMKTEITQKIVGEIMSCMKGRFLEWNPSSYSRIQNTDGTPVQVWRVLSFKKACEKVAAALKNQVNKTLKQREKGTNSRSTSLFELAEENDPVLHHAWKVQQDILREKRQISSHPIKYDSQFDVLTGKGTGAKAADRLGHRIFLALVRSNGADYRSSDDRRKKRSIVRSIFFTMKYELGGRFLVQNGNTWDEQTEGKTIKKIAQACRDAFKYKRAFPGLDFSDFENETSVLPNTYSSMAKPMHTLPQHEVPVFQTTNRTAHSPTNELDIFEQCLNSDSFTIFDHFDVDCISDYDYFNFNEEQSV
eukprot:CAMPEP_0202472672 /NCGR_PEP_ID=MMETSP1360-20130828/88557_1 /ASSEMBLY_ACC=CAM_ASM_000848 /TAXON_ID=515479 /ORGANISM="Licmophora paradoxa, Strain CCMP2313" /LENGTH=397 /DNA_ID=CAMNT_0049099275 /DNA_START=334 /DNA_END=1527 /DNA_ORIENTATION=+